MSASWDVQAGLYAFLQTSLASLSPAKKVYDKAPEGIHNDPKESTRWPFIEIGESFVSPDDSHTKNGQQEVVSLHIWSRYGGDKEVKQIGDALVSALHHAFWEVVGWAMVYSRVEARRYFDDPDGVAQHGVVEVRIAVSEV